ncbi:translocation/assembly module TamB domain-containing protein [Orbaceae bacterium ac157xtp]
MKNPLRAKKIKKLKRIRKWKKRSLAVLCTFVFLISFLLILIYTSLGIKIIVYTLDKVMPELHIEHTSGALNDLKIEGFSLELDGVEVKIANAELSISGLCLLEGKLCVKNFEADNIEVNINTDKIATDPENRVNNITDSKRSLIKMPLPLELRNSHLSNVAVNVDDMHFGLSDFKAQASWIGERIYVFKSSAKDVQAVFSDTESDTKPSKQFDKNKPIGLIINDLFNKPLIESLPEVDIPMDFYVNQLIGDNWLLHIGGQDFKFNNVDIKANTINNNINAQSVSAFAKTPYGNADVKVNGSITLGEKWPITATVNATSEKRNDQVATQFYANVTGRLLGTLSSKIKMSGLNRFEMDSRIDFVEPFMPVIVKANGSYLQWPPVGTPQYQLNDFTIDLSGNVKQFDFNALGNFVGQELPIVNFNLQSKGTNQGIAIKRATLGLPQGEFDVLGEVNWANKLSWQAEIDFKNIDLTNYLPKFPIKLNGQFKTHGELLEDNWSVYLNDTHIVGNINHAELKTYGDIAINSEKFICADDFNFNWGKNKIVINGTTKNNQTLLANLDFPELKILNPELRGHIKGDIKVKGAIEKTSLETNLEVKNFIWKDIIIGKILLNGETEYNDLLQGSFKLVAHDVDLPNLSVKNSTLELSGDEKNHHLIINIDGTPATTSFKLDGHLNGTRTEWKGSLYDMYISLGKMNGWQLDKVAQLNIDLISNQLVISAFCLINNQSKICLDKKTTIADNGEAKLKFIDIDLALFDFITHGETRLAGTIQGTTHLKWQPDQAIPIIDLDIYSDDVYVKQMIASQMLSIPFDLFKIQAHINSKQAKLDWNFSLKELGKFNGKIEINDPSNKKQLTGRVDINELSLSLINPLLNDNEYAKGHINSQLKFSGTLVDPYITGFMKLEHSEIMAEQLPVDIKSIMLNIDFKGKSSQLDGILRTKSGSINVNGKASWQNIDDWTASVNIKGDELALTIPPMMSVSVLPNIKIEANQNEINLDGVITIPQANIKVESLPPSVVDVSSDEVMLDNDLNEVSTQKLRMRINSRVLISLGDHVMVDAFGLTAQLKGDVYVTQTNRGLTVNGDISIPSGRFHAYGQDLLVRKGEIVFAGSPEQPRLNIEAIRNPESIENNVTAGIRVTGLADSPKVEIFSDPALSQQEALSYLLRGQGLEAGEQNDGDMLTALLIGFGTAQSGKVIGDIGNAFGIKNLSLDTQGVGDNQKVVVSGYILPHLQLKYGIGIFDSLATFTLRYRLLPRLYLEAASGLDQTVDLIYQFEF